MGSIFARLRAESISKVVLDFERPVDPEQLSEECRETYIAIGACVDQTAVAIKTLTDYSDLKPVMKVVMDQKRVDEHKEALESSMGSIVHIQEFYRLADKLNEEVPKLLNFIKSDNLKDQEALCQVFTRLLDKVIQVRVAVFVYILRRSLRRFECIFAVLLANGVRCTCLIKTCMLLHFVNCIHNRASPTVCGLDAVGLAQSTAPKYSQ